MEVAAQEKDVCWQEQNGSRAYLVVVGGERRGNGRTTRKKGSEPESQQEQTINEGRSALDLNNVVVVERTTKVVMMRQR